VLVGGRVAVERRRIVIAGLLVEGVRREEELIRSSTGG
jgi:hypothetical protein